MTTIETNLGNFGSTEALYKFMKYEHHDKVTITKYSYCLSDFGIRGEYTIEEIRKVYMDDFED